MAVDGSRDLCYAEHKHKIEEKLNETRATVFNHGKNSSVANSHSNDWGRMARQKPGSAAANIRQCGRLKLCPISRPCAAMGVLS
jgi:hypothetical protein